MKRIPKTTLNYIVQGHYGQGWEDLCSSDIRREARENLKDYRNNTSDRVRLIKRREPNPEYVCPTP